ncbi:Verru_Chthon cassette protein B [Prosthecobacter dejongeii]|uniref:Uncharacterized protein (TIGR02598 family) n=1 Tax=Prosthecobacter dejongeii TaxID=48465 RepID=A0A7W8DQX1_9BACT|nr:Verru_Chthon cassette protein B [Prosthecobacter dejongeii]MBB5038660.1 uncharacterized protein (TIGR02598 family) [Prosthecobacter dejongeii]
MNTSLSLPLHKSSRSGFSLVEVVMAVGIMALGVVTILGLLPHGLKMTSQTANEQAETRIVDFLVGELQSTNWTTVDATPTQTRYFDDQGLELDQTNPDFGILLTYVVQVNVPEYDVRLPNNDGNMVANQNLRRVIIKMIAAPLRDFNFDNPTSAVPIKIFTQSIANMGIAHNLP